MSRMIAGDRQPQSIARSPARVEDPGDHAPYEKQDEQGRPNRGEVAEPPRAPKECPLSNDRFRHREDLRQSLIHANVRGRMPDGKSNDMASRAIGSTTLAPLIAATRYQITERGGFEPPVELPPHSISSAAQSAALSPLPRTLDRSVCRIRPCHCPYRTVDRQGTIFADGASTGRRGFGGIVCPFRDGLRANGWRGRRSCGVSASSRRRSVGREKRVEEFGRSREQQGGA